MIEKIHSLISVTQAPVEHMAFELRRRIVAIITHPQDDSILLIKDKHGITFPGGGVDDETLEKATLREAGEETGYENFINCRQTGITLDFFKVHKGNNRLSKNIIMRVDLQDLTHHTGEMEILWVKKELVHTVLETEVSKAIWQILVAEEKKG